MSRREKRLVDYFWSVTEDLLTFLAGKNADHEDSLLYTRNVIVNSDSKKAEGVASWRDCMLESLHPSVKYCKTLNRVLGSGRAAVYHAIAYRDIAAIDLSCSSQVWKDINVSKEMQSERWTPEDTATFWEFMDDLTRASFDATSTAPGPVPTRDELAESIRSSKKNPDATSRAFTVAVQSLCESRGVPAVGDGAMPELLRTCGNADAALMSRIGDRDVGCLDDVDALTPMLGCGATKQPMTSTDWTLLSQVFTMSSVSRAVPGRMMSSIESVAAKMAQDVVDGKCQLTAEKLQEVSAEVMGGMNQRDIAELSQNVQHLLPALNAMRAGIPGMPSMADFPGMPK